MLRAIRVPRFVKLLRVPTYPEVLPKALDELQRLELDDLPEEQWPYLEVRLLFEGPEPGARAAVESAIAGKPLRLARIDANHARRIADPGAETVAAYDDLDRLQPEDIFLKHYRSLHGEVPDDLRQAFQELLLMSSIGGEI